jgi:hypothetical protein
MTVVVVVAVELVDVAGAATGPQPTFSRNHRKFSTVSELNCAVDKSCSTTMSVGSVQVT